VPKLGEKRKLLDLSQKNVMFFKKEKIDQYEKLNPEVRTERLLTPDDEGPAHEPPCPAT
jgi:excinuclease ABC subunit C